MHESCNPYSWVEELRKIWSNAEEKALVAAREGEAPKKEDNEEEIGSKSCVDCDFAGDFDSISDDLIASDAKDFASTGQVFTFDTNGDLVQTIEAGIIPGGFWITD